MLNQNYRQIRSDLIAIAEEANRNNFALHFTNLDQILLDHAPKGCSHHMATCDRQEDYIFELCTLIRAIEAYTRYNSIAVVVPVSLQ